MRHITLKDEQSNFFVLKKSKQENQTGSLLDLPDSEEESGPERTANDGR